MFQTIRNFCRLAKSHPLSDDARVAAFCRLIRWQLGCFLLPGPKIVSWVNGSSLVLEKGMVGATGNYYFGLHEFEDMSFVLHFLQKDELFVDIGANVGTYTVLAGAVKKAKVVAVEPAPNTFRRLTTNVQINQISTVNLLNVGLGATKNVLRFSTGLDAENHVLTDSDVGYHESIEIPIETLDEILDMQFPTMIKMDVEGFELEVIRGGVRTFSEKSLQALLIELNGAGERYGFDEVSIRDQLEEWGFHLCRYDPLLRKLDKIDKGEVNQNGNGLYIRDHEKVSARLKEAPPFSVLGRLI